MLFYQFSLNFSFVFNLNGYSVLTRDFFFFVCCSLFEPFHFSYIGHNTSGVILDNSVTAHIVSLNRLIMCWILLIPSVLVMPLY